MADTLTERLAPHANSYEPGAFQTYTAEELRWWVQLLRKRAAHRTDEAKRSKDLYDADNYEAMLQALPAADAAVDAKTGLSFDAAGYLTRDVSDELRREVEMDDGFGGRSTYVIESPVTQVIRKGGVTIRIIDARGTVHLVPGPGYRGAVHRWVPRDPANPVQF
jgi:hypothetical protein